ncbi:DUF4935 domain-containing protein [Belnapia sp. T6]|uniref:DUF4935 domain-containing protein n=1 Tax=Belnapia mucosa TaxID=2804532 RepID=A0ABS1V8S7_9PROT|nr:PIN domain-containing protein [Belnapia mucosa]MBL6458071.1 DUF4935 domain-containing protein [Belnapia mucosa]
MVGDKDAERTPLSFNSFTFDTQAVQENSFRFDRGLLAQIEQFRRSPIQVVVADVVLDEIFAHLVDRMKTAVEAHEKAQDKLVEVGLIAAEEAARAKALPDPENLSRKRISTFMRAIGAAIADVDAVSAKDLTRMYFQSLPPFSRTKKEKKHEFPDAIALLSLEAWAEKNDRYILAATKDSDWAAYAQSSRRIKVVDDLARAMQLLQEHAAKYRDALHRLLTDMAHGEASHVTHQFSTKIENALLIYPFYGEGHSVFEYELDQIELTYLRHEFENQNGDFEVTIVRVGMDQIVAEIRLKAQVRASAIFSFSVRDSVDKDYVSMGSGEAECETEIPMDVLVTFSGDIFTHDVNVEIVEILRARQTIYFGLIEPDFLRHPEYDEPDENQNLDDNEDPDPSASEDDIPF